MMRAAGIPIDDHSARQFLVAFATRAPHPKAHRQKITADAPHDHRTQDAQSPHSDLTATALYAGDKVSLFSNSSSPNGDVPLAEPKTKRPAKQTDSDKSEPDWVKNLRRDVTGIDKTALGDLTLPQRVILGQYHAYRFEHFTTSHTKCVNRGSKHISAIADLGKLVAYEAMTVAEYRGYMQRLMAASGALVRSPWALKGAIEDGE